ncbi:MAG: hypothetical protein B0D92_04470 [Spirochaeta sp. LUC14_002_19_P3]|nr:MAG: hypothetical protein B0D92_04470 [Spirochaeta sp. LUC14_002_19_P3]
MTICLILCFQGFLGAQSAEEWFNKGIEAFKWQKPNDAAAYFIKAAELNPDSPDYPFYTGLCYYQAKRYSDAEAEYEKSLKNGGNTDLILFQRGNLRWSMNNYQGALDDYTLVVNGGGKNASAALLNRANLELNMKKYNLVIKDYTDYLAMKPTAPNRANIEKIIALLSAEIKAAELAEARRLAEEAKRAEEEARRRALMAEALESLNNSGDGTRSISEGTETIHDEFSESELED